MNPRAAKIIGWSAACAAIIGAIIACRFWYSFEATRTKDARTLSYVRAAEGMLETYRQQYAAYPGMNDEFARRIETLVLYEPLAQDGSTLCKEARCPKYRIEYALETNVFESKGAHTVTPLLPTPNLP